jgi:hypothetical protein
MEIPIFSAVLKIPKPLHARLITQRAIGFATIRITYR